VTLDWLFSRYAGVVVWDFEYREDTNCRQLPVSATFLELKSGRRVELWEEFGAWPPFPTTRDWAWVSYHASAETKCHLVLNWAVPETILDLEAEFRCETTNRTVFDAANKKPSKKLPEAMREYGLSWSDVIEKPAMIKLILHGYPYNEDDRRRIVDYNWIDTDGLAALLPRMLPDILARPNGWALALVRGYYSGHCVARMEHVGTPLDTEMYYRLDRHWDAIRARMVAQYDPEFGVYDGLRFVTEKFIDYLLREDIPWPVHESGIVDLREKTFQDMGRTYPQIERLRQIRMTMAKMRLSSIKMGADGRNRTMFGQFVGADPVSAPAHDAPAGLGRQGGIRRRSGCRVRVHRGRVTVAGQRAVRALAETW
jgi:DNA polymerase I